MIDIYPYSGLILISLTAIATLFYLQAEGGQRRSRRWMLAVVAVLSVSFGLPYAANKLATETLQALTEMERLSGLHIDLGKDEFLFAFNKELDIIREMNDGGGKLIETLKLAPETWGWKPELFGVQVSLIQVLKACYPDQWGVLKDDLFRIPLNKPKVRARIEAEFKEEALNERVFCNFETLMKLI